jgi:hypothetical protein
MAALVTTMNDISGEGSVYRVTWNALDATNNVGNSIAFAQWADRSVQFNGVFNNATVVWEGSNDGGTTWTTLTDPQGNAISKTAAAIEAVTEITQLARPNVSSAGVNTAITVAVILRRANPMRT